MQNHKINTQRNCDECDDFQEFDDSPFAGRYFSAFVALTKTRSIFISEDITKQLASEISSMLFYFDSKNESEEITIYINTDGGDVAALMNIYDIMKMVKAPIKTICIGKAYSAGAVILLSGTEGRRAITKHSKVMLHGPQFMFPLQNKIQSETYFKYVSELHDRLLGLVAKHTKKPLDQVKKDLDRDAYLTAEEALKYGIVDTIL